MELLNPFETIAAGNSLYQNANGAKGHDLNCNYVQAVSHETNCFKKSLLMVFAGLSIKAT